MLYNDKPWWIHTKSTRKYTHSLVISHRRAPCDRWEYQMMNTTRYVFHGGSHHRRYLSWGNTQATLAPVCVSPTVFISAHVYVGWQYRQCLNGPGWVFSVWCVSLCLSPSQQFLPIQVVFIQANNDKIQQFPATSKHIFWFSRVICWCSVFLLLASLSLCPFPPPVDPSASGLSASELGWTYPK